MPDLPTLTVTTEQQARILAAFKDKYGTTTNAETIAAYKQNLAAMIRKVTWDYETKIVDQNMAAQKATVSQDINSNLIDPAQLQ